MSEDQPKIIPFPAPCDDEELYNYLCAKSEKSKRDYHQMILNAAAQKAESDTKIVSETDNACAEVLSQLNIIKPPPPLIVRQETAILMRFSAINHKWYESHKTPSPPSIKDSLDSKSVTIKKKKKKVQFSEPEKQERIIEN